MLFECHNMSHNPYFSRWFSAISNNKVIKRIKKGHNPYFSRWFSAIEWDTLNKGVKYVTILILVDGFLQ